MPGRRTWLRLLIGFLILLLILTVLAWLAVSRLLAEQQISQVEWQGLRVSTNGLHLEQLSFQHPRAQVATQDLHIGWPRFSRSAPWLNQIDLKTLHLNLTSSTDQPESTPTKLDTQQLARSAAFLPQHLRIDAFNVSMPCAEDRCELIGALQLNNTSLSEPEATLDLKANLNLLHDDNELAWQAQLHGTESAPELQLQLAINQQPQLNLLSSLQPTPAGQLWHAELDADIQQAGALHSWLRQWLPAAQQIEQSPQAAELKAQWSLLLPAGPLHAEALQAATGAVNAHASLPQPWPVPLLGQLQGNMDIVAKTVDGQWLADSLSTNLTLSRIPDEPRQFLPDGLRPDAIQVKFLPTEIPAQTAAELSGRALPVKAQIMIQGQTPLVLDSTLILSNNLPWAAQLIDAHVNLNNPALHLAGAHLTTLKAALKLDGYVDQQRFSLQLGQGSTLSSQKLAYGQWQAEQLNASTDGLKVEGQLTENGLLNWQAHGALNLSAKPLHEQLSARLWRWRGPFTASATGIETTGTLSNDADLSLNVQAQHSSIKGLTLKAQLAEVFLRNGNPFKSSFTAWPALLDFNSGRLKGTANVSLKPKQSMPEITAVLTAKGLSGIYNRTELSNLTGNPTLRVNAQSLQLDLPDLSLEQANPGVPIGPLQVRGSYQATLSNLATGSLRITQAQTQLIGGQLQLSPGQWALGQKRLLFPLQLRGLELEQLFILYPTEGLSGQGTIDGNLPLQLDAEGFSINNGNLQARAPGGYLKFNSERIRQLGRSNPAMQLVTQSLEDFQFTTLSSQVNYDPQGKLTLGIRLEGKNPAIEKGRPIHFNINLQEDIPTLLASLQLSDKVSEIIQQRVQKYILERNVNKGP